uniref:Uncharacterized protein n=1 Tax=Quercus lobata TaxID=97700 RepID=A0A7N2LR60_QUELO
MALLWAVHLAIQNRCFGWVHRSSNSVANVAARFALNYLQPFCFSEVPFFLIIQMFCPPSEPHVQPAPFVMRRHL